MSRWSRRSSTAGLSRTRSRTSAPASSWDRAAPRPGRSSRPPTSPATKGPKRVGPFAVPEVDVLDRFGDALDLVQDQGRQLFDLLGLRDLQPLHRRGLRAHPDGQAGRDVRRRLRGARLDAVGAVRRHGRDVLGLQRHARARLARLRQEPRRLRHLGRRRRAGARGLRAGEGARARRSTARSSATARPRTATTWSRPPARARRAACGRRSRP